ncbi:hypothetical protein GZ77_01345 [Endozoicomonas montiporae]|uniref:Uncharacterized protein n=1 Tax=Endozoicomonas montiporae TaxID=1027273 RepID=A0A081NA55_9GAMM|nr:hypothetical protein GZ77_01345 [Endozoicomonas montiporae]
MCCLAGTRIALASSTFPSVQVYELTAKKHCSVPKPDSDTARNLHNAIESIEDIKELWTNSDLRQKKLDKLKAAVKHGLPVNAAVEKQINFSAKGPIFQAKVSLLDMAVMLKQHDVVDMLLEQGANPEGCGTRVLDPSYLALSNNDFKSLNKLIEAGANVDKWIGDEALQQTILHHLASHKKSCTHELASREATESMHLLLNKGANINARDVNGETPLTLSVRNCQYNPTYSLTILLLLTHGADPFISPPTISPPKRQERHQKSAAIIGKGGNIFHKMVSSANLSRDNDLWRLLTHYVWAGGDDMMLVAGAYPDLKARLERIQNNITAPQGRLASLWNIVTFTGRLNSYLGEILSIFSDPRVIQHDPDKIHSLIACQEGQRCYTPLHKTGFTFMTPTALEWLEWLGSDFSELSSEGHSVLHYAIKSKQFKNLHLLKNYPVNPLERNHAGMTGFDLAMTATPGENSHSVFSELCHMSANQNPESTAELEICTAFFDLLNAGCTQFMAPENNTLSANSDLQQRYLSSFAMKGCQSRSHQSLSQQQKLEILNEPLETTYQRTNAQGQVWLKPDHLLRRDMDEFPELKNYLIKHYPGQAEHLKHNTDLNKKFRVMAIREGLEPLLFNRPEYKVLMGTGPQPSASMTDTFSQLNQRTDAPSLANLDLQQLQSFAQLKHYLMYDHSAETDFLQTYLVQRNDPALFMYTLTMGIKPIVTRSKCDLPDYLSNLCQTPLEAIRNIDAGAAQGKIFNALMSLAGHYDFLALSPREQLKDLFLYHDIQAGDIKTAALSLSTGANPNAFITREHYEKVKLHLQSFHKISSKEIELLAPKPGCGLLTDTLRMEINQPKADLSRLLLMYGASVDPVTPRFCELNKKTINISPLYWADKIKDKALSELLNYFDPAEVQHRAWEKKSPDEWYTHQQSATNTLSQTSEFYSLILGNDNDIQTPLCTCLGLQKIDDKHKSFANTCASEQYSQIDGDRVKTPPTACTEQLKKKTHNNPEFAPFCQQQLKRLPEFVKESICSPATFH